MTFGGRFRFLGYVLLEVVVVMIYCDRGVLHSPFWSCDSKFESALLSC